MPSIFGYRQCAQVGCGRYLLDEVAYATAGLCARCWLDVPSEERKRVEVLIGRQTAVVSTHRARTRENARRQERRRTDPGYQRKKGAIVQAKRRAARRLAAKYRAEYLELLAQERGRAGLDPWPAVLALEYAQLTSKTMGGAETYAADDAEAQVVEAPS